MMALLLFLFQQMPAAELQTTPIAEGLWLLSGPGGNIVVSSGADGTFLIDDQVPQMAEKVKASVAAISKHPIRLIINTHWHFDHTGGNEMFGKAGVTLIAHENVRRRMAVEHISEVLKRTTPASPPVALPVVTFADALTIHLNGDDMEVTHVPPAHTDGDAVIFFKKANLLHTGDVFTNGRYPFLDIENGGSINGYITDIEKLLKMVDAGTRIVPGHGPMATRADMERFLDMLIKTRDRVSKLIAAGKSLDEAIAAKVNADLSTSFKGNADMWITLVYKDLSKKHLTQKQ